MKCKIHPQIELKENLDTHEMTYCSECSEDTQLEWGKKNKDHARQIWTDELKLAIINKKQVEVDCLKKRLVRLETE